MTTRGVIRRSLRGRPQEMTDVNGSMLSVESIATQDQGFVARVLQDGVVIRMQSGFRTRGPARTWAYNELRIVVAQLESDGNLPSE